MRILKILNMKKILIVCVLCAAIAACRQKETENKPEVSTAFQAERDVFFNSLKTPDEIASGDLPNIVAYNVSILHDPAKHPNYFSNKVKSAANMGIYIADLNYNLLYNQRDVNDVYFNAAHELSKAIGIEQGILQFLAVRYSKNLEQNDSLKNVVSELLQQSTKTLRGTDRERLAGVAIAASQIENLHLVLSALESISQPASEEQQKAYQQLSDYVISYRANVEVSYNFMHSYSDPADITNNPNYPYFDNALRELIATYRALPEGVLSATSITELKNRVEPIRSKIIE